MSAVDDARKRAADRTAKVRETVERADRVIFARRPGALTFGSPREALEWYFAARRRMSAPQGMHVSTDRAMVGQVDGGRGGDIDNVHATMSTIGAALALIGNREHLTERQKEAADRAGLRSGSGRGRPSSISPDAYGWILQAKLAGINGERPQGTEDPVGAVWTDAALARRFRCDPLTVSKHVGLALERVARVLQRGGVIL